MDTEKENKKWEKILTGCSMNTARMILILECIVYGVTSKMGVFITNQLIFMGAATYLYVNKNAPFSVFIFFTIIQFLYYLLLDKVIDKDWDNEQIEMKYGIKTIKSYINKIK
jgi:hypothetical protein